MSMAETSKYWLWVLSVSGMQMSMNDPMHRSTGRSLPFITRPFVYSIGHIVKDQVAKTVTSASRFHRVSMTWPTHRRAVPIRTDDKSQSPEGLVSSIQLYWLLFTLPREHLTKRKTNRGMAQPASISRQTLRDKR